MPSLAPLKQPPKDQRRKRVQVWPLSCGCPDICDVERDPLTIVALAYWETEADASLVITLLCKHGGIHVVQAPGKC